MGRPLRLLLVVDTLTTGGAERHVVDLARALAARGHAITVACSAAGALAAELRDAGVPVRTLARRPVKRRAAPIYAWRLHRLVIQERVDLVHAHVFASALAAALAILRSDIPLVVTAHSHQVWQRPWHRRLSRLAYARADRIIAVSQALARHLIDTGVAPERLVVLPNAIGPAPQQSPVSLPGPCRGGPLIGVVARLVPEKGVDVFLEAAAMIGARHREARFLVVGDGPQRSSLERRARRAGLEKRVHFLGAHPAARSLIVELDLLVVPSRSEGAPLVVLEAIEAGVPLVASAVGGIPEQIRHACQGTLVPPDSPAMLAEAVSDVLTGRAQPGRGRHGVEHVCGHAALVDAIVDVYRQTIATRRDVPQDMEATPPPLEEPAV